MPQTIQMANLGMADSLILMVMALVVFGPRRLPKIGRQIGKIMYEFRKASNDFKFQMEEELRVSEEADRRQKEQERQRQLELNAPKPVETPTAEAVTPTAEYTSESMVQPPEPVPTTHGDVPRILPPSSGDPVEAQRPNRAYVPPTAAEQSTGTEAASESADTFVAQAGIEAESMHATPVEHAEPLSTEQATPHA